MSVIDCPAGKIKGRELQDGIYGYLGIPYCEAPLGKLRFRAPQPLKPFDKVFEAFEYSKIAPQPPPTPATAIPGDPTEWDENCLTLNIFARSLENKKQPVMVFIHGGGFVSGASSSKLYWGVELAKRDVILVTINYRLGALGFLAHPNLPDPDTGVCGNWGLLDQIAALKWVKSNIEAFGGDAEKICVFGESAGSISIADLATSDYAQNCFNAMILESGPAMAMDMEHAQRIAKKFSKSLGYDEPSRSWLEEIDAKLLVDAQGSLISEIGTVGLAFQPVIDGQFLKLHPRQAWMESKEFPVPMIIGTNKDEMMLFAMGIPNLDKVTEDQLKSILSRVPSDGIIKNPMDVYQIYREKYQNASPLELWSAIMSDWVFRIPSIKMADLHAKISPSYLYRFDWETPLLGGVLKACHALELPFVFGSFSDSFVSLFAGGIKPGAQSLSDHIQTYWSSFASSCDVNNTKKPHWEKYESLTKPTMLLNDELQLANFGQDELVQIWY